MAKRDSLHTNDGLGNILDGEEARVGSEGVALGVRGVEEEFPGRGEGGVVFLGSEGQLEEEGEHLGHVDSRVWVGSHTHNQLGAIRRHLDKALHSLQVHQKDPALPNRARLFEKGQLAGWGPVG